MENKELVNKSECSKKFKKICGRTVLLTKKETHLAKDYSELWNQFSRINENICKNLGQLKSTDLLLAKKHENIKILEQLKKDSEEKLENVKRDIKAIKDKINTLHISEPGRKELLNQKIMSSIVLKILTKTFINDEHLPYMVQGFVVNEVSSKIIPFKIDPNCCAETNIQEALWENVLQSSSYSKEWDQLFTNSIE